MAKITVVGYVSEWKYGTNELNPVWGMKISEPHYKKVGDKFEKIGATNFTVKAAWGKEFNFQTYGKGEKVEITGTQVSEDWEANGKKGKNLVIKADEIKYITYSNEYKDAGTREPELPSDWKLVDEDVPF